MLKMFENKTNNKKEENTTNDKVNNYNFDISKFLVFVIDNINGISVKGEIKLKLYFNFFE